MKVLVVGATGQTGKRIVQELVQKNIPVKALVRDLNKGKQLLPATVELIQGDVLKPELWANQIQDCHRIICATGAAPSFNFTEPYAVDYEGTKNLINLAKKLEVEHFVLLTSLCVSRLFHPLNLFWLILYWKKQAELYLQESGLTYTIVRPGGLKNEDNNNPILMSQADSLFEGSIPRQKVAQVCVESLFQASSKNKIVEIISDPQAQVKSWEQLFASV
jgi:uncharacterized protein YbjT (DUF2867 family)